MFRASTPQELLKLIREAFGIPVPDRTVSLRESIKKISNEIPEIDFTELPIHVNSAEMVDFQFRQLASILPADVAQWAASPNQFLISQIHDHRYHGEVLLAENGGALVMIHDGLITFLYKVCRALSTRMVASDSSGDSLDQMPLEFSDVAKILATTLSWLQKKGIPYGPDFDVTGRQLLIAHQMATYAEWFVFCHEIAHVRLGHFQNSETIDVGGLQLIDRSHSEEFEADRNAFDLLMKCEVEAGEQNSLRHSQMVLLGATLFFRVDSMLVHFGGQAASVTHPSSLDRLECLQRHVGQRYQAAPDTFENINSGASAICDYLDRVEDYIRIRNNEMEK